MAARWPQPSSANRSTWSPLSFPRPPYRWLALLALACTTPPPCSDCGGVCVDLQSDSANCGACGQSCGAGQRCEQGRCAATCAGLMCDGTCVDAMNDPNNCGAC